MKSAAGAFASFVMMLGIATDGHAEDSGDRLETIVVTGSRISYRDLLDTPAVSITRPGDYLLLPIKLVNDSRSEEGRRDEIHATIRKMIAGADSRFEIVHGETYVSRLDTNNYRIALDSGEDDKNDRPDTSRVSLYVRTAIRGVPDQANELTHMLREFVDRAERVGRTEIDVEKESALSLSRPERFRHEIIRAIADDTTQVRSMLGQGCEVAIEGLGSRIEWQRVSVAELMLYIPYTMEIRSCGSRNDAAGDRLGGT